METVQLYDDVMYKGKRWIVWGIDGHMLTLSDTVCYSNLGTIIKISIWELD